MSLRMTRVQAACWITGVSVVVAGLVIWCWRGIYNHDEVQHLHAAWLIWQGLHPFADFVEQHHPTLWYLLAPLAGSISSPHRIIFAARLFDLAMISVLAISVLRIARRLYPTTWGFWPVVVLMGSSLFLQKQLEVRPDALMNVIGFAGIALWLSALAKGSRVQAFLAGLLSGLAIAVLQKWMPIVVLLVLGSLLSILLPCDARGRRRNLIDLTLFILGAIIPVGTLIAAAFLAGWGEEFLFWNYTFNRFLFLRESAMERIPLWIPFLNLARDSGGLVLLGLAGLGVMARGWGRRHDADDAIVRARLVVIVLTVGSVFFLLGNRNLYSQYFLPWLVLLAICSQALFARFSGGREGRLLRGGAIALVAIAAVLLSMRNTNEHQIAAHRFILNGTRADRPVAISPPMHPIVRFDTPYFWYNGQMLAGLYAEYCRTNACAHDFLAIEDKRWEEMPPDLLYLAVFPTRMRFWPYRWQERLEAYRPLNAPGFFVPKADE